MAATKLTLRLDEELVASAKGHARRSGKSVSQLVAADFRAGGLTLYAPEELLRALSAG